MKRFEAFFTGSANQLIMKDGFAIEARFDITAENKERALELLEEAGSNPDDFYLEETNYHKDQMGKDFPEGISDARLSY
jgi:hypothetical protein